MIFFFTNLFNRAMLSRRLSTQTVIWSAQPRPMKVSVRSSNMPLAAPYCKRSQSIAGSAVSCKFDAVFRVGSVVRGLATVF